MWWIWRLNTTLSRPSLVRWAGPVAMGKAAARAEVQRGRRACRTARVPRASIETPAPLLRGAARPAASMTAPSPGRERRRLSLLRRRLRRSQMTATRPSRRPCPRRSLDSEAQPRQRRKRAARAAGAVQLRRSARGAPPTAPPAAGTAGHVVVPSSSAPAPTPSPPAPRTWLISRRHRRHHWRRPGRVRWREWRCRRRFPSRPRCSAEVAVPAPALQARCHADTATRLQVPVVTMGHPPLKQGVIRQPGG
mmetsp:Transcript_787/g.2405  ORF Transcript_787/g.2405 Transcript_787/m.2405 type:complete len:250 (+) Transcript_787:1713-2462(+)